MTDATTRFDKWPDVWRLFDADEQHEACFCLVKEIAEGDYGPAVQRLVKRVADGTGSRVPKVLELAHGEPDKLAHTLRTRAQALFDYESWNALFSTYYFSKKSLLMCAFLDRLGIAHSEKGGIDGPYEHPTEDAISTAVEYLSRTFAAREIGRYLAVLMLHDPDWSCVANERDKVLAEVESATTALGTSAASQGETVAESSAEFTVLDRVIIDQIVRSAMGVEGSLDPRSLEELVETMSRLNEKWHRSYFFLA